MELLDTLRVLCTETGVSGDEKAASEQALALLKEFAPGAEMDAWNNVMGVVRIADEGQPTVLLDAHIDEIGLIVTQIDARGFIKVNPCGGIDRRLLLGQEMVVYGNRVIQGVVASIPPHLSGAKEAKVPEVDGIYIDVGMEKDAVKEIVSLGDRAVIRSEFRQLLGTRVASKAIDDRCGAACILRALDLLRGKELHCGISVLFSAQEETGTRGAMIGGYRMKPDIAVALDVSFAHTPDAEEDKCGKMGGGVMIGMSPTLDREISAGFVRIAKERAIPSQTEVMGGVTGTNADAIGTLRGGVRCGLLSIPEKYMHTPVEVVDLQDCESTAALLAAFLEEIGGINHAG